MSKYKLIWAALLCAAVMPLVAQTPYSQYGYGTLDDNATGNQRAMGGTGIGMRNNTYINMMNPASYTAMDSLTFMFDFSADYKASWYNENGASDTGQSGGINYVAMQFRLGKKVAAAIGLTPLSHVQYTYGSNITNGSYTRAGEGGMSQVFLGVAVQPFKWMSVGVNAGYVFGKIDNITHVVTKPSTGSYINSMTLSDLRVQFGLQFPVAINDKNNLNVGVTYTLGKPTWGEVLTYNTFNDTIIEPMGDNYSMPHAFGAGVSYTYNQSITAAVDARYELWEDAKFYRPNLDDYMRMNNRWRVSAGLEYRPKLVSSSYLDYIRYRIGGFYEQSYITVRDDAGNYNSVREFGVSCGLGFPLRGNKSMFNFTLEYSHRNGHPNPLLSEDHLAIVLSMTFNEMWFWQRKFE